MSLRRSRSLNSEGLPVFRTGMNSSARGRGGRGAEDSAGERVKHLQRKPPVPTAAAAAAAASGDAQVAATARPANNMRDRSLKRDKLSPGIGVVRRAKSPGHREIAMERAVEGHHVPCGGRKVGGIGAGRSASSGSDRKQLLRMLRQAVEEMDGLRRDVASANRERGIWRQRDGDLSLTVSRLEGRCEALERDARAGHKAAEAAEARAKEAEARFARLVVWAREEEGRRVQAEERLRKACEAGQALEARSKTLEEEARESKCQLEGRRFKLEGALEDLRTRTSEKERLEAQATTVRGQAEALRELADARGFEVKELREKITGLVKEAKGMSSENVDLRKQMSSEQERWRAAERSRAKQDERRRTEMEQKGDDIHALRYRVQELEARVSSETARRQGAEEDARRSQEMERRSMEELLEGKAAMPMRTGVALSHSFSPHRSAPATGGDGPVGVTQGAWKSWGDHPGGTARDTATATTGALTSGARSAATASDLFNSVGRVRRDTHDPGDHHHQFTDAWRWREAARTVQSDHPAAAAAAVGGRNAHAPSPSFAPPPPPPPVRPPPPPPLSAASLRASLRRPGGDRSRSRSPSPTAASGPVAGPTGPDPFLRPRPHARSPIGQRPDNDEGRDKHDDHLREVMGVRAKTRPQPRRAPSEEQDDERDREGGDASCNGRASDCESEWWAGGASGREQGFDGEPDFGDEPPRGAHAHGGGSHQQDKPLNVVCL